MNYSAETARSNEERAAYRIQVWTASRSGAISVGGSTGLAPNNSRARPSSARTSLSCCCSPESATGLRYPNWVIPTIHHKALNTWAGRLPVFAGTTSAFVGPVKQ